jgi:putative oxidoreductase
MSVRTLMQKFASVIDRIAGSLAFLAPLLTRLAFGTAFFFTGRGKWANFERTAGFFTELGIPLPQLNAAFVSSLELVGGILLILGLGTRIVAALLSCSMVVALLTADKPKFLESLASGDVTDVTSVPFLLAMLWLALYGAGPVSLDALVSRWLKGDAKNNRLWNNHPTTAHSS